MSAARGQTHHDGPPGDPEVELAKFPRRSVDELWFRCHADYGGADHGWYFSSVSTDPDQSGRFDVPAPSGTCYFGSSAEVAVRERVGPWLARVGAGEAVAAAVLSDDQGRRVVVSQVPLNVAGLANLPARAAQPWVNRSLSAGTGIYRTAQSWAAAFLAAGFAGILYEPRFTVHARARAVALFGPAGARVNPPAAAAVDDLGDVLAQLGIRVVPVPSTRPVVLDPAAAPPPL